MAQLKKVVDPFGEVNVYPAQNNKKRVVATILMEPFTEGAQTGIALDGSGSMSKLYGVDDGARVLSPIFGGPPALKNEVTPVAQKICAHLARKLDADGGTTCIYWAVGAGGSDIEVLGDFTADQVESHTFDAPKEFGTGTQLLPAVKYFVERFADAPWGFYVFITDGELHDLDAVMEYTKRLARDIESGRRHPVKLVLIGLGDHVNVSQMEDLDDLETGTQLDLWDHKLAAEMRVLQEIFAEVVDKNARICDRGKILDPKGQLVKDYGDLGGLPAWLEFEIDEDADYFTLDVGGHKIHQSLADNVTAPASDELPVQGGQLLPETEGSVPVAASPAPSAPASDEPRDLPKDSVEEKKEGTPGEYDDLPLEFESGSNDINMELD